jgi:DNA replication licensing factor MCM4
LSTINYRFDLIYLVLDKPDERTDRRLAAHLVSLYYRDPEERRQDYLDVQTLTEYISFARKYIHPVLTEEAAEDLTRGYVNMRKLGGNSKTITATPRQLESLIRISEALAKMRFSDVVERVDVAEALRLLSSAMQQAAVDPRTGTIDMDLITTGYSATSRSKLMELTKACKDLISKNVPSLGTWKLEQLHTELQEQSDVTIPLSELRQALRILQEEEFIAIRGNDRNGVIRRLN